MVECRSSVDFPDQSGQAGSDEGRGLEEREDMARVEWKDDPDEHDYPAAEAYLGLLADRAVVAAIVEALRGAPVTRHKAKDILRASGLPQLPADNVHVAKDVAKVKSGRPLSPVLLVRGEIGAGRPLQVADGYHRVCASYHLDEDTDIPCRMADVPHRYVPDVSRAGESQ